MVHSLTQKTGADQSLVRQDIHRHGAKKGDRNRILKVLFRDVRNGDLFIRHFHKALSPELANLKPGIIGRRDLSPAELQLHYDYERKKERFDRNEAAKRFELYYINLRVFRRCPPFKPLLGDVPQAAADASIEAWRHPTRTPPDKHNYDYSLRCCFFGASSLLNKFIDFKLLLSAGCHHIGSVSETWLRYGDVLLTGNFACNVFLCGMICYRGRVSAVALLVRSIGLVLVDTRVFACGCELLRVHIISSVHFRIIVGYWPPQWSLLDAESFLDTIG